MTTRSLPKCVTDAAIPRRVNATMLLQANGKPIYFVAGSPDGNWSSRGFTSAAAFARFIRANYQVVA